MTEHKMLSTDADGKVTRIDAIVGRRELGEAQGDIKTLTGKPERKTSVAGVNADLVRDTVSRVETLEGERKLLADDIKEIISAAAERGVDAKVIRELVRERKKKPEDAQRQLSLLPLYRAAMEG